MKASQGSQFNPFGLKSYEVLVKALSRFDPVLRDNKQMFWFLAGVTSERCHHNLNLSTCGVWDHSDHLYLFALCDFVTSQRAGGEIVNMDGEEITPTTLPRICIKNAGYEQVVVALPLVCIGTMEDSAPQGLPDNPYELVKNLNAWITNHFVVGNGLGEQGIYSAERYHD